MAIVGTKLDLVQQNPSLRQVESNQAKQYAQSINAIYAETSSKTGANVDAVFNKVIETAIKTLIDPNSGNKQQNKNTVDISENAQKEESGGCC